MTVPSQETTTKSFRIGVTERIETRHELLSESSSHLLKAAGKGIRPTCVRLVGEAVNPSGPVGDEHSRLGDAVELLHTGSLVHDDILDEATMRRGVAAVHAKWGEKVAVLAGDYLLSQASILMASLGIPHLCRRMGEVLAGLCEGELLQDEQQHNLDVTIVEYLERVAKKTSGPFELACEGAAILSGGTEREAEAARMLGYHLGRLFQMIDDLLDWSSNAETLGKPVGQDLMAGNLTLPVLVALAHPELGPRLRSLLTPYPKELGQDLKDFLFQPDVYRLTLEQVEAEVALARKWLHELPKAPSRDELESYLDQLSEQARLNGPAAR